MKVALYYAGMANDARHTEQIGLALSDDGAKFSRTERDGLIIPSDDAVTWKNLRTCNPTVLLDPSLGEYVMFYQGVGNPRGARYRFNDNLITSLALARSKDGVKWISSAEPILSYQDMRQLDSDLDETRSIGVIEPSVLHHDRLWHMWFVYFHHSYPGNALFHATSGNLTEWSIDPSPILKGYDFPGFDIHYPQVVHEDGNWQLWFTLRDRATGGHGIFRINSQDGAGWSEPDRVLPLARDGPTLDIRPRQRTIPMISVSGREGRSSNLVKRVWNRLARLSTYYGLYPRQSVVRAIFGYAHPHLVDLGKQRFMYFQFCNLDKKGLTLDVGRVQIENDEVASDVETVFKRSAIEAAWDGYFAADPFLVVLDDQ